MSIQLLYQNINGGAKHDITTLVTALSWSTKRAGAPGTLDITIISDPDVKIDHGSILALKNGGEGLFYGYVFKHSRNDKDKIQITAYDQLRYLKNKDTYVFKGKRADQVVATIAADFKIKIGNLANTGYVIPRMVMDSKNLFDIILHALDLTLIHSKRMFYLWDDYGLLRISNVKDGHTALNLGDGSLVADYEYQSDIDSDTANRIKLVRDNKETGKRDVYIVENTDNQKRWGMLQHYDKVDEKLNKAQIETQADNLLALKNRPTRTLTIEAIADLTVRAGRSVFVKIADIGISGWYVIDECKHNLIDEKMSLKLVVV
ncbi:XkdQ/YqbQ family protein [Paenibacillus popilliae]|uniref:YqbQ/XkdQ domain-containing protein n=1 Tax=Paenibacillus popilliae ATCC 14706 TaxID=1212764 RepID=M9LZT9_PAEPP|nr:hypothetical protein [Paenibacillus popilliae]GAC41909.1 hypothetical protein PPOP_1266 [Paenibacillus popilliae ATCC 14706]